MSTEQSLDQKSDTFEGNTVNSQELSTTASYDVYNNDNNDVTSESNNNDNNDMSNGDENDSIESESESLSGPKSESSFAVFVPLGVFVFAFLMAKALGYYYNL